MRIRITKLKKKKICVLFHFQWFQMTAFVHLFVNREERNTLHYSIILLGYAYGFFIVQKCLFGTQLLVNDMEKDNSDCFYVRLML